MKLQLEINGEPYTGTAFKTNDGILIHLPGVQAASAAPFETLFQGLPENKLNGGFLEAGEWNGKEFSFETQVTFGVGPDGKVWAQVCDTPGELPDAAACDTTLACKILDEAEEAFNAKSMAEERAANGGGDAEHRSPKPVTVSDYLFCWKTKRPSKKMHSTAPAPRRHGRGLHPRPARRNELRELGFTPSPEPWLNKTVTPSPAR
jgi:hypothetical protein